ncbi:Putative proteolipid membrane potential modulator [Septoria linicola]|uniref:Proteolipid membrane potential modulator n=1 Tax=Septoria linicola TaxID=215465 RepID=A0A9Q9EHE6_9PEZI|nr:putative proteolipid membrane potential modulator [Septoria linicola]USW49832.1 Putative proteolipid membrane potential modulator [Septoria linicola]
MVLGGLVLGVIAIFLPPLPVALRRGCSKHLILNIILCILGWLPGILHSWYIILESPSIRQRNRRRRRSTVVREEVYVPPRQGYARPRSRSRSVGGPHRRTRSRSVGRIAGPPVDVYAGTRQPYYREEVYSYDTRGGSYAPPPKAKY